MQQVAQTQAIPQAMSQPRRRRRGGGIALWCVAPTSLFIGFILLPLAALVWRAVLDPTLLASLTRPMVLDALWVTGLTASATLLLALLVGTPLAYVLARKEFPGKWLVETATDLPLVLPPVTAGVALLMAFGRRGTLGSSLAVLGIELPFTMTAVVLAQLFVAGSFYIRGAKLGLVAVTKEVEEAAAVDGASAWESFWYVTLPLAMPGITSGIVLCLARAVSEFGATLMFAGNFTGRTQTMSLAIMAALETDLSTALALAVILVGIAAAVLILSRVMADYWID